MSKKSDQLSKLLDKVELRWPVPEPIDGLSLLEQGLAAVLQRHFSKEQSLRVIEGLRKGYADWNELRVAQPQEVAQHYHLGNKGQLAARQTCAYLQEVFQYSHGLSLDFLRDDPAAVQRFVFRLDVIGLALAHALMAQAVPNELPVTPGMVRVLDRLGLVVRTSSMKKARAAIEPLLGDMPPMAFATKLGEVATRWCDPRKPACHECVLVDDCKHGKKVFKEWKLQQERMSQQRAKDAARLAQLQKKEDEKRRREDARAARKAAADAQKKARETEKRARADAQRALAVKAKLELKRRRDEEREKKLALAAQKKKEALLAAQKAKKLAQEKAQKLAREKAKAAQKAKQKALQQAKAKKPKGKKGGKSKKDKKRS